MKAFMYLLKNDLPRISNNIGKLNIRHLLFTQLKYDHLHHPSPKKQTNKKQQHQKQNSSKRQIMIQC